MKVAIIENPEMDYCREAPFHPPEKYPEYPFEDVCKDNRCYGEVRNLLHKLGLDNEHYNTGSWNPLGEMIKPGNSVFIKPNFVSHFNPVSSVESLITQGSMIRALLDYVYIALKGKGKICIGDAPSIEADFKSIRQITGLDKIAEYYSDKAVKPDIIDLRKETGYTKMGRLIEQPLEGDPLGYSPVDLKNESALVSIMGDHKKFRANNYNKDYMLEHHNENKNEYCISNSILNADVIINMPKLKTHCRTGITCSLKNLVGINGYKSWLPHHRAGSPKDGGDEYENKDVRKDIIIRLNDEISAQKSTIRIAPLRTLSQALYYSKFIVPFKDDLYGGSWHGNDTLPRTISDLNRIAFYADKKGVLRDTPQRKMFIVVDGIVGGEKEGPQTPSAKKCGILVAGYNPVEVDAVCCRIMGFDQEKISTFKYSMNGSRYKIFSGRLDDVEIMSDRCHSIDEIYGAYNCHFMPSKGWEGYIEHEIEKKTPAD
jgi:uncharacterized protein (DUF362 family)